MLMLNEVSSHRPSASRCSRGEIDVHHFNAEIQHVELTCQEGLQHIACVYVNYDLCVCVLGVVLNQQHTSTLVAMERAPAYRAFCIMSITIIVVL